MKDFNEIYKKIDNEYGESLEKIRKKIKRNKIIFWSATIVFYIIILLIMFLGYPLMAVYIKNDKTRDFISVLSYGVIIGAVLLFEFIKKKTKLSNNFQMAFKNDIIKDIIKEYNQGFEYYPSQGISILDYIEAGFNQYNKYSSDDLIIGNIGGKCDFKLAQVKTEKYESKKSGNITYFDGMYVVAQLNKIINTSIKIRVDEINPFKREKITLDSIEFEKIFDIQTGDKLVAYQLFTADVMEILVEFVNENAIIPEITINNNKLYVRFYTGDIFEIREENIKKNYWYNLLKEYYNVLDFTVKLTERLLKNINATEI